MPPTVKKRPYVSPTRQAKAEATRARIIQAAAKLFLEDGYGATSTAAISREAETSEASVFAVFGSKAELLVAVVVDHVTRDEDFPVRAGPAWPARAANPDKEPAIAHFARVVRRAHDRSWRLLAVASAAAQDDPAVRDAVGRASDSRRDTCAWFVREVIGITGSEVTRLTDEIWALTSVENYRHLVIARRWPPADYEAWLSRLLNSVLRQPA